MSMNNDKERAIAENGLQKFLVDCCDEAPGLEVSGMAIAAAYMQFCKVVVNFSRPEFRTAGRVPSDRGEIRP